MIHAKLSHNPYLLKTVVTFNGQEPRINSQIEKYESCPLADWVDRVPEIFYDEMNGYDFNLDFSGTLRDFELVSQAFQRAGVSGEQVRLFLKNELEDAEVKCREIDALLRWLADHPNRTLDEPGFRACHTELFDSTFPYILVRGGLLKEIDHQISLERIECMDEVSGTDLSGTPILFYVDERTMDQFRRDLVLALNREDVSQAQLFFLFHPELDTEKISRIICDLGVDQPQPVTSAIDEPVRSYFKNYPVLAYIREAIGVFETTISEITELLVEENRESARINAENHSRINALEESIRKLKETDRSFVERDNFDPPGRLTEIENILYAQIRRWRNRKTKVVGEAEAEAAAREFRDELKKQMDTFANGVLAECQAVRSGIFQSFRQSYAAQGLDPGFIPEGITFQEPVSPVLPPIAEELMKLREVSYEETKPDLFNRFRRLNEEESAPVPVLTCYYEHWRTRALLLVGPVVRQFIQDCTEKLRVYYNELAQAFHGHLLALIAEQTARKDAALARLSVEERALQEDNDWLSTFREQLTQIERG